LGDGKDGKRENVADELRKKGKAWGSAVNEPTQAGLWGRTEPIKTRPNWLE